MPDYRDKKSSGVAKAALATAAAVGGVNLLNGSVPLIGGAGPFRSAPAVVADPTGGYVTDKEMNLIRESGSKDAIIAQLTAEKYADAAVKTAVDPLNLRICDLETAAAVNAARDKDFRRYVEREFVHQPKASIRESIVVCKQRKCECGCCDEED